MCIFRARLTTTSSLALLFLTPWLRISSHSGARQDSGAVKRSVSNKYDPIVIGVHMLFTLRGRVIAPVSYSMYQLTHTQADRNRYELI